MEHLRKNLAKIRASIVKAEQKYNRPTGSVVLVAISKLQSVAKIKEAISHKQIHFGESYLPEALIKIKEFPKKDIIWHYIGKIQTKKTKLIAQNFSWVETVTTYEMAELLNKYRQVDLPKLNICIQVNISNESTKSGILIPSEEILPLAKKIIMLPRLKLRGLMTIPAYSKKFDDQFKAFNNLFLELQKLRNQNFDVDTLSMGMSEDFEAAIAAGATIIRIGTAIFGERIKK